MGTVLDVVKSGVVIEKSDLILVTGANGFVGSEVVRKLLAHGFANLRCLTRTDQGVQKLSKMAAAAGNSFEILRGNLLSSAHCKRAVRDVSLILHLAAGMGNKSFAGSFLDSVVTTKNLLDASIGEAKLKRFLTVSSLSVYSGFRMSRGAVVDELAPIESNHRARYDSYSYAKTKQDQLVAQYGREHGLPFVIVRLGPVYGPGKEAIPGRVGISTFGIFLNLSGSNRVPVIFLENCADAIVLCGLVAGIEGETFNAVDDELPTGWGFLRLYKKHVHPFRSIYVPYRLFYLLNRLWEKYSKWSEGQLPPVFNRRHCAAYYQRQQYSNGKLKARTGWRPKVSLKEAMQFYCEYVRSNRGES